MTRSTCLLLSPWLPLVSLSVSLPSLAASMYPLHYLLSAVSLLSCCLLLQRAPSLLLLLLLQALIELNEANAVRTTYEQIASRLKEERIGLYKHLEALEANIKVRCCCCCCCCYIG